MVSNFLKNLFIYYSLRNFEVKSKKKKKNRRPIKAHVALARLITFWTELGGVSRDPQNPIAPHPLPVRRPQEATGARSREAARRARLAARLVRLAGQASDLVADRRAEAASRPVAPVSRCDREIRDEVEFF